MSEFNPVGNIRETKRLKRSSPFDHIDLDIPSKMSGLKVAPSVVSIVSYSGDEELFQCTGTIIKAKKKSAIVLTSAYLLMYPSGRDLAPNVKVVVHVPDIGSFVGDILVCDFHYSLAAIKIKPNIRLTPASTAFLNDSFSIDPNQNPTLPNKRPFGLREHSDSYPVIPGDPVIAIGCYFEKPYQVMAAPGVFCLERSDYDCKELCTATCKITRCGVGGPLVNCNGDVIGICFYSSNKTSFLPMNVALTWWEQFKKHGDKSHIEGVNFQVHLEEVQSGTSIDSLHHIELRRPLLGMDLSNLHLASFEFLAVITQKFPNISEGIYVEKVTPGSSADAAGIKRGDCIIQFGGNPVRSFLELLKESWDKIGEAVDMVVIRKDNDIPLHLSMVVDEVKHDKLYKWKCWR